MKYLFLILVLFLCSVTMQANTFKIAIRGFSHDIKPESYQYNPMVYILRQLHEPLFVKASNGIKSNILKTWKANQDYSSYTVCILDQVFFSNGKKLTPLILKDNIEQFKKKGYLQQGIKQLQINGNCLIIGFKKPYYGFMEDAQSLRMAVLYSESFNSDIPIGISPYFVFQYKPEQTLILRVAPHVKDKPYYQNIEFKVLGVNSVTFNKLKSVHEINLLSPSQLPPRTILLSRFQPYKVFEIRNSYIFINHPDKLIRSIVANCVNRNTFAKARNIEVKKIMGKYLPEALGSTVPFVQKCNTIKRLSTPTKIKILFYYNPSLVRSIEQSLNESLNKKNVFVKVVHVLKKEVIKLMESPTKAYDAVILRMNGMNTVAYLDILGLGTPNKTLVSFTPPKRKSLRGVIVNGTRKEKYEAIDEFFNLISSEHHILPIAEHKVSVFYPKEVAVVNDNSTFSFFEYKIKDLRK